MPASESLNPHPLAHPGYRKRAFPSPARAAQSPPAPPTRWHALQKGIEPPILSTRALSLFTKTLRTEELSKIGAANLGRHRFLEEFEVGWKACQQFLARS